MTISRQIKDTPVPVDLSDQFPSLLGQEMFTPLCTTLAKYGGGTKQELDFDLWNFGDKLLCEFQAFVLEDLEDIFTVFFLEKSWTKLAHKQALNRMPQLQLLWILKMKLLKPMIGQTQI